MPSLIDMRRRVRAVKSTQQITKAMKQVAGRLRLSLAQYRELAAFAQFGSELDKATQSQLTRGERMVELLKQEQYAPMPLAHQVAGIFAGVNGYLDTVPLLDVRAFETGLYAFIETRHPQVFRDIAEKKQIDDPLKATLNTVLKEFAADFAARKAA